MRGDYSQPGLTPGHCSEQIDFFSVHLSLWPHEFVVQNWLDALRRLPPHAATRFVVSLANPKKMEWEIHVEDASAEI
jgi:hypothetical protein